MPPSPSAAELDRVAALERSTAPRWVWEHTEPVYRALLEHGVRVRRAHDLYRTEALLLGAEGRWDEFAAATHELGHEPEQAEQPGLFGLTGAEERTPAPAPSAQHQRERIRLAAERFPGFPVLVAAESAGALAAVEMSRAGMPWHLGEHDRLLTELLGPRPRSGRPAKLQQLAGELADALDDPAVNPDSPQDLLRSLRRAGLPVHSTSRWELARHDHPAVPLARHYKELARLWTAHGWAWADTWVREGRFHPEYVPAGVISGRWATRGGGALQIPKAMRGAVVAPPGRALIVADAGQLEPRVLAALSRDRGMIAATRAGDLYTDLAEQALGAAGARAEAKLAMISAMYGGGTGSTGLAALRRRFPVALAMLEDAARRGEDGLDVYSVLGRACPPAGAQWSAELNSVDDATARSRARSRGRFTRNFVIQASAADWAAALIAGLRLRLMDLPAGTEDVPAQLVFFQHDEVMIETGTDEVDAALTALADAAADATRLVLGDVGVDIPLQARAVHSYAEK